jgi:hypothetical protein
VSEEALGKEEGGVRESKKEDSRRREAGREGKREADK